MGTSRKPDELDRRRMTELKRLRRARKWNQAQLAQHLDISPQQLGKYERGENRMPVGRFEKAIAILGSNSGSNPGFEEAQPDRYRDQSDCKFQIVRLVERMESDIEGMTCRVARLKELVERL